MMRFIAIWIAALLVLAVAVNPSAGVITCPAALPRLLPCLQFLQGTSNDVPPACCEGANSLNQIAAGSKEDLRELCRCLKQAAVSFRVNVDRARELPQRCNINAVVPIDPNVNCDTL